ncbi:MAG: cysteine hydrolase [Rhizobiaceae bacterium]|nr:cysteine hydrolase [Rhizobiaceae bacterium]
MSSLKDKRPTLLLIDIQKGFLQEEVWGGQRNNKDAEIICQKLLNYWRENALPIIHIQHASTNPQSPLHPSQKGFEFQNSVKPHADEMVITKNVNSAFIGTDLKDVLDDQNVSTLIIIGLTTDHCVSTTTRMAGNYGYEVFLISDATATFDKKGQKGNMFAADLIHETALASLNEEFANVLKSDELFDKLDG